MSSVAILSIRPEYSEQITARTKKIELRKSSMGIKVDDIFLVYESAPKQCLSFWFQVSQIEILSVEEMWNKNNHKLGISKVDYDNYFRNVKEAVGFHVGSLNILNPVIPLSKIRSLVSDFMPPQGLIWIKEDIGRFRYLIQEINPPLPEDTFLQTSFFEVLGISKMPNKTP
jgi:predicted transcriptional regulator